MEIKNRYPIPNVPRAPKVERQRDRKNDGKAPPKREERKTPQQPGEDDDEHIDTYA